MPEQTNKQPIAIRRIASPRPAAPPNQWFLGLDFGQRQDHSALAAFELTWDFVNRCPLYLTYGYTPKITLRRLRRYPLGVQYEELREKIIDEIRRDFAPFAPLDLVIDAGGPGIPNVEFLRASLGALIRVHPVMITSGTDVTQLKGGFKGIPRNHLISRLLLTMSAGTMELDDDLKLGDLFEEELASLDSATGHPAAGGHDDLVIAGSLGLHWGLIVAPELLPAHQPDRDEAESSGTKYGFKDKPLF